MPGPAPTDARLAVPHAMLMLAGVIAAARLDAPQYLVVVALPTLAWWIWQQPHAWRPPARFGLANALTAIRVGLAAAIAALPAARLVPWGGVVLLVFFVLDGVDGWWARRSGTASRFGAAFDQEADAFMVAVVSLVVVTAGLAPSWVVIVGALRYGYVLVVWALGTHGEAPRSTIARHVFGVLVTTFIAVMLRPSPLTRTALTVAAVLLMASFARSLWWSWRGPVARG